MNRERLARIIENMRKEGLEQLLVTSTPAVYYLTGKWIVPNKRMMALYISAHGDCVLYANRLFAVEPQEDLELVEFDDTQDPVQMLSQRVKGGKLGIDNTWPTQFTLRLMAAVKGLEPVMGSAPVEAARMCKDAGEIALMRENSRLNDEALRRTMAAIRAGITERELQEIYLKNARDVGGEGMSFAPITCFGPHCAEPHHINDDTPLKAGDSVILDVGLVRQRYCSDMTRTVFFGHASDEQKKVYEICRRANEAGRAAVRPGLPMSAFDRAARQVIEEAGYGKYFIHRTGHGIGMEVHEFPDNSATSQTIARPGMCFSVEPGIYLPGRFGVRIEDLVVVTEDGGETLNQLDHDLKII